MATYIMLSRLSPEGVTTLKNNPDRVREVNTEVEELGARVVAQYALLWVPTTSSRCSTPLTRRR